MVFGGDFRQILPVKIKGSRETTVAACLRRSYLWADIKTLTLTENMRLARNPDDADYAEWLLKVGDGKLTAEDGSILLQEDKRCGNTVQSLIQAIYPGIHQIIASNLNQDQWFCDRTILCPRNDEVDEINECILDKFPGELKTF